MRIGFVGLGQMGAPIAANIVKAGFELVAYDRDPLTREQAGAGGVSTVEIGSDLGPCDLLMLCLPHGAAVREFLFGPEGGLSLVRDGGLVIDLSTVDYADALNIAEQVEASGYSFLDAPISGMEARAIDGTLTVMAGGDEAQFRKAEPVFNSFATTVLHMGAHGAGQLTKLVNQLLLNINAAAVAEVLPMATKLGLDCEKVTQVINTGTGRSFASEFFAPRALDRSFVDGYPMQAAYKDLVSASGIVARDAIPMPVLAAATAVYQQALQKGLGHLDKGAMIQVHEDTIGVRFARGPRDAAADSEAAPGAQRDTAK